MHFILTTLSLSFLTANAFAYTYSQPKWGHADGTGVRKPWSPCEKDAEAYMQNYFHQNGLKMKYFWTTEKVLKPGQSTWYGATHPELSPKASEEARIYSVVALKENDQDISFVLLMGEDSCETYELYLNNIAR